MLKGQGSVRLSARLLVAALVLAVSASLSVVAAGSSAAAPVVNPKAGKLVAKADFEVKRDGFSFENWGPNDAAHSRGLSIEGMRAVFGDEVCARIVLGVCSPTTVAELVQQEFNDAMTGGHCFGMAALAGLYATKRLNPFPFAMPWQSVYSIGPSAPLDELIARMFITQGFPPTDLAQSEVSASQALSRLRSAWTRNDNYVLAIYTDEERQAGHAINPIAIRDLGEGKRGIVVYDNNFPGVEKMVVVDPAAERWYYSTATNPSEPTMLFQGSAANKMMLVPLASILARHQDPDLRNDDTVVVVSDTNGGARGAGDVDWDVRVTDPAGRTIPGVEKKIFFNNDNTASFTVPANRKFRIVVDGVEAGRTADINATVLSSGGAVAMGDLEVPAGATAVIDADPARHALRVSSSATTTAEFQVATEDSLRSLSTETSQLSIGPGSSVSVGATSPVGVTVLTEGRAQKVRLAVERSDTLTDRTAITRTPVTLRPGAKLDVPVNLWTGWGPLTATVRSGASVTPVTLAQ
ncbi:hypothetical protein IA539_17115 [Gordonia sp. zg691]|uniref:hypothetical protein n=1 Tax=Gordonia jinghuaiqii TaxID=2758710 RepID=UPI001662880B|nr:hypothetical protein [Gordonia jinghuaiqii]MBD0862906.1 hypothetical protein [Gordonia jinghuaiqii]